MTKLGEVWAITLSLNNHYVAFPTPSQKRAHRNCELFYTFVIHNVFFFLFFLAPTSMTSLFPNFFSLTHQSSTFFFSQIFLFFMLLQFSSQWLVARTMSAQLHVLHHSRSDSMSTAEFPFTLISLCARMPVRTYAHKLVRFYANVLVLVCSLVFIRFLL